jgi:DNA-binding PadR family transcriptional regulator
MPPFPEGLPLTEPTLLILLSLAPGPKHGYAIMKEVELLSEGRVHLSTGTLYGALKRFLDEGWIARVDDPEPNDTDRVRKAYSLTDRGRHILRAEVDRLHKLLSVAKIRVVEA